MCLGTSSQGKDGLKIETEGKSPMHSQPATFTCGLGPWTLDHQPPTTSKENKRANEPDTQTRRHAWCRSFIE